MESGRHFKGWYEMATLFRLLCVAEGWGVGCEQRVTAVGDWDLVFIFMHRE